MAALTEQSVFTCLPLARPQLHILSNSPAMAAVARPSASAPASADVTIVLIMVISFGVNPQLDSVKTSYPEDCSHTHGNVSVTPRCLGTDDVQVGIIVATDTPIPIGSEAWGTSTQPKHAYYLSPNPSPHLSQ